MGLVALGMVLWLNAHRSLTYLTPLFGSILITIGWMVTSENTVRNSRRQQSVSIVLHYSGDQTGQKHRETIIKYVPDATTVIRSGVEVKSFDDEQNELLKAIDYQLNTFEFIAIGILREVLDEELIKDSFYSSFLQAKHMAQLYIQEQRTRYGPTVWAVFSALCEKWEKEKPDLIKEWPEF